MAHVARFVAPLSKITWVKFHSILTVRMGVIPTFADLQYHFYLRGITSGRGGAMGGSYTKLLG